MEFGLAQLLEMFERQLGPRATSGLVYLIAAGVAAAMLGIINDRLGAPLYRLVVAVFGAGALSAVPAAALSSAIQIILICVLGGFVGLFLGVAVGRTIARRSRREADARLRDANDRLNRAVEMFGHAEKQAEFWKQRIAEGERLKGEILELKDELLKAAPKNS